eukprot:TRINITY_DN2332_c0_g1_i2.p1 TRINITY_DN2332_c0_g1~~TRINITY_DN2332_c0_g1_i2.p1  ORF type:complete len:124 (-),score=10.97 TRINITY_DN2332_c0_g1_i2:366-737(-)
MATMLSVTTGPWAVVAVGDEITALESHNILPPLAGLLCGKRTGKVVEVNSAVVVDALSRSGGPLFVRTALDESLKFYLSNWKEAEIVGWWFVTTDGVGMVESPEVIKKHPFSDFGPNRRANSL